MSTDHYLEHLEQKDRRWCDATGVRDPSQLGEATITFTPGGAGLIITPASASVVPVTREVLEELLAKINGMRQQLAAVRELHRTLPEDSP